MQPQLRRRFGLISLAVLFFLAAPSLAARRGGAVDGGSDGKIARATMAPHLVSFEPLADFEAMSLRVTDGDRVVFEGEFAAGQAVLFDLFDLDGQPLADGTYIYELKATPRLSGEIRSAMEASRLNGTDGEAGRRLREIGLLPERGSMTMSGAFTILNGAVVDPDLPEETTAALNPGYNAASAPQDVVVNDDKIIIGSLCVGFDCINGESFGFDTIRLKENNLRVHFQDTSNSASFPTRDYRLVANDSSNGGASYFALEDTDNSRQTFRVFSGAPSNALVVDAQGDLGLGTATAVVELHIVDGDTPTVRLEQDNSSGFTAQTWDLAGNETNFFVRDVTMGSRLPFRIRPGAATSSIDIAANGNVGMGTSSPDAPLHVNRTPTGDDMLHLARTNAGRVAVLLDPNGADNDWRFEVNNAGNFQIDYVPSAGAELTMGTDGVLGTGLTNFQIRDNVNILSGGGGSGNLSVAGSLTKGSGAFKIDHPLDPANKFLYHSFVESPDMMNIYNGNVVLDENGEATVEMPDWFEALNRDFRYQLTPIGAPGPGLYVAQEVTERQFRIAGGQPGSKVSWQLTGIRHDRFADANRIPIEEVKPDNLRGTFTHPELYRDLVTPEVKKAEVGTNAPSKVEKEDK